MKKIIFTLVFSSLVTAFAFGQKSEYDSLLLTIPVKKFPRREFFVNWSLTDERQTKVVVAGGVVTFEMILPKGRKMFSKNTFKFPVDYIAGSNGLTLLSFPDISRQGFDNAKALLLTDKTAVLIGFVEAGLSTMYGKIVN